MSTTTTARRASMSTENLEALGRNEVVPAWIRLGLLSIARFDTNTGRAMFKQGEISDLIGIARGPLGRAFSKAIEGGFLDPASSIQNRTLIPGSQFETLAVL